MCDWRGDKSTVLGGPHFSGPRPPAHSRTQPGQLQAGEGRGKIGDSPPVAEDLSDSRWGVPGRRRAVKPCHVMTEVVKSPDHRRANEMGATNNQNTQNPGPPSRSSSWGAAAERPFRWWTDRTRAAPVSASPTSSMATRSWTHASYPRPTGGAPGRRSPWAIWLRTWRRRRRGGSEQWVSTTPPVTPSPSFSRRRTTAPHGFGTTYQAAVLRAAWRGTMSTRSATQVESKPAVHPTLFVTRGCAWPKAGRSDTTMDAAAWDSG